MVDEIRWDEKAGLRTGCGVRSQVIAVLEAQIKRRPAMRKVSIAGAQASRKISAQKLTVGLDPSDRSSWYCVLDEVGTVLLEQKLSTTAVAVFPILLYAGDPKGFTCLHIDVIATRIAGPQSKRDRCQRGRF
jgi:hypothetical protein